MKCPYCRKEITEDAQRCWYCKAAVEVKTETAPKKSNKKENA